VPWYPKAILAIATVLALVLALVRPLRGWALRVPIGRLIALHLIRFVGFYFLYLYGRHELPYRFAVLGGMGDILVAALAVPLLFFAEWRTGVALWNLLGLADILAVAATAARSEIAAPGSMHQLDQLPLILLPTLVVPAIIVTHLLMLVRVLGGTSSSQGGAKDHTADVAA
jgi:hypothetical protein